jgi:hypothetical protein
MDLLGFEKYADLKEKQSQWVDSAVQSGDRDKDSKWTQRIIIKTLRGVPAIRSKDKFRGFSMALSQQSYHLAPTCRFHPFLRL